MLDWHTHPDEDHLLRFSDGELRPKETARIARHLEACWACRTQLDDLKRTITDYVHYRKAIVQPELPPPPQPWNDIRRQFERVEASRAEPLARIKRASLMRRPAAWALATAAAAAIGISLYLFTNTPRVEAAELLRRAVISEKRGAPAQGVRYVRFRMRNASFVRRAHPSTPSPRLAGSAQAPDEFAESLFSAAHYSWDDPLSAEAFASWRNQLPEKTDEVRQDNSSGLYELRTTTTAEPLRSATIFLRIPDLHAVRERLEFSGDEWLEMTEAAPPTPEEAVGAPGPAREARRLAPAAPAKPAGPDDEVRVFAALHRIGADLGDPIEIVRKPDEIVVTGAGLSPKRADQVRLALAGLPRVAVQFTGTPGAAPRRPEAAPPVVESGGAPSPLQAMIARQFADPSSFQGFSDRLLETSEAIMARAHALRRLAERFPPDVEQRMSAAGLASLTAMREDHALALDALQSRVDAALNPVLARLNTTVPAVGAPAPPTWQAATESLFDSSEKLDRWISATFATTADISAANLRAPALARALGDFDAHVAVYRTLAKEARR
jgi:hypothetical protein